MRTTGIIGVQDTTHSVCASREAAEPGEDGVRWCAALWLRPKAIALGVAVRCAVVRLAGTSSSMSLLGAARSAAE
jgi:hypothetical protein